MIKLLVLCLLATLVTVETTESTPSEASPSTLPHSSTTGAEEPLEHINSTHHPSPHSDTKESPETSNPAHHSTSHPSSAADSKTTSENTSHRDLPTASLTCNCTRADCREHHCTTEASKRFCVTTAEENTLATHGTQGVRVSRTCGDNVDLCNKTISITVNESIYWRSNTACCHDADHCNSHSLNPPPTDSTQGKLVCPSCFAVSGSHCTVSHVKCAASETNCINVSGTVENGNSNSKFVGQGCATSSATLINGTTLVFGNATYHFTRITTTEVRDGASQTLRSVPFTFLLSSFVGLLQAKFIY